MNKTIEEQTADLQGTISDRMMRNAMIVVTNFESQGLTDGSVEYDGAILTISAEADGREMTVEVGKSGLNRSVSKGASGG